MSKLPNGAQLSADYVRMKNRYEVPNHEGELNAEK